MDMDLGTILSLVKQKAGISTTARDGYITSCIKAVLDRCKNVYGISLDVNRHDHIYFVADYVYWLYKRNENPQGDLARPPWLQRDLNNLRLKGALS